MRPLRYLSLTILCAALLSFTEPAFGRTQTGDQLRTPAESSAERNAILAAVTELYKAGDDKPTKFKVNYLKVHNGWAWIDVTPLADSGSPLGEPAPLLFKSENGKWTSKELNDVGMEGDTHEGPHDPSAKYLAELQKKYPGIPADIFPMTAHATSDPIKTIRARYASINKNVRRYRRVKRELSGYSLEGGEMTAYFSGPKIVKIVADHYGEGGRAVEEYYYWDDRLIFVYRKDHTYDKPGSGKVVMTLENRFYFVDDKLVRWIDHESKQRDSTDSEYSEREKDYLGSSKEFTDGARSKKRTIESSQTP